MKASLVIAAALLSACATQPKQDAQSDTDLATRISQICALPESQRDAEIEKMKQETGMVLYCGRRE